MTLSLRQVGIAAAGALALAGAAYVYGTTKKPATQTTHTTDTHSDTQTSAQGSTVTTTERGPITVHRKVTTPTAQGPRVEETTVTKAPVTTTATTSVSAQTTEKVRIETRIVERPASWWRVYGEAGWKPSRDIALTPNVAELGLEVKPLPVPLWLGAKVDADPRQFKETTSFHLTARAEWP